MPSIFDNIGQLIASNPGATPDPTLMPSILDTKAYRNQQLQDTLLGMSKALIQAGAPSPYPRGFADAFGAAGAGAAEGAASGEDKYLKRALVDSQIQTAQDKIKQRKALSDLLLGAGAGDPTPTPTVGTASLTPGVSGSAGGGPSNPTNPGNLADGKGGFQTFPTPEAGVAAAVNLAKTYQQANGGQPITLAQIEQKWAPPDNGKDPMTRGNVAGAWAKNVATYMGVDPNQPLDFNDPKVALAFAPAVHAHEHGPGKAYQPNVYQAGVTQAYGGQPAASGPPVALASAPPAMPPAAGPVGMDFGAAPPPTQPVQVAGGPVASLPPVPAPALGPQGGPVGGGEQPPANASGTPLPPQGPPQATPVQFTPPAAPTGPVAAPQVSNTVRQVVQNLKPAERQLLATMEPEAITKFLLDRASPNQMTVLDSTNGAVVFVDKNDPGIGSRYQPVKAAELGIAMRNAAAQEKQAAAREEANRIRGANEPLQPGATPGAPPTPTPGYAEQKGAVTKAEETAKVQPRAMLYQAENAIKDHEASQNAAAKARSSNNNMARLETLLDGVDTGKMKSTTNDIKAYAKGLGIDIGEFTNDDVGRVQAAKSLLNQMALEMRNTGEGGGMPGSMSDSDRQFLTQIPPGIETTPEGRKMMIDYQKRVNQRTIDVARIKNEYMQSGEFATNPAGMWAKVQQFADSHPMFDPAKDKLPTAGAPAGGAAPITMNAIDAEMERRRKAK